MASRRAQQRFSTRTVPGLAGALAVLLCFWPLCVAEENDASDDKPAAADAENAAPAPGQSELAYRQEAISLRYKRFEQSLIQMAEAMRKSDPERASLLFRAVGKS